jgi:hypothetical protein
MLSLQGPKMVLEKLVKLTLCKKFEKILLVTEDHLPEKCDAEQMYSILVQTNVKLCNLKSKGSEKVYNNILKVFIYFFYGKEPFYVSDSNELLNTSTTSSCS